jgi:hypothetical protein
MNTRAPKTEPEMQAWWEECLGMESGALFMKRFMDTQMYSNYRYSDAIQCVVVCRSVNLSFVSFDAGDSSDITHSVPIPPPHTLPQPPTASAT